jgi:hypothetical protein
MIAKIIVHAPTREAAIRKMRTALNETADHGVETNLDFQFRIMYNKVFCSGEADTGLWKICGGGNNMQKWILTATWRELRPIYPGHGRQSAAIISSANVACASTRRPGGDGKDRGHGKAWRRGRGRPSGLPDLMGRAGGGT